MMSWAGPGRFDSAWSLTCDVMNKSHAAQPSCVSWRMCLRLPLLKAFPNFVTDLSDLVAMDLQGRALATTRFSLTCTQGHILSFLAVSNLFKALTGCGGAMWAHALRQGAGAAGRVYALVSVCVRGLLAVLAFAVRAYQGTSLLRKGS